MESLDDRVGIIKDTMDQLPKQFVGMSSELDVTLRKLQELAGGFTKSVKDLSNLTEETKKELGESSKNFGRAVDDQLKKIQLFDAKVSEFLSVMTTSTMTMSTMPSADPAAVTNPLDALISLFGAENAPPYLRLIREGERLMGEGKFEEARATFIRAAEADLDNDKSLYSAKIAETYAKEEDFERAVEYYIKAIEDSPETAANYNNMGTVYFSWGQSEEDINKKDDLFKKGAEAQIKALSLADADYNISSSNAIMNLLSMSKPDSDLALEILDKYGDKKNPEVLLGYARIYAVRNEISNLVSTLAELGSISPNTLLYVVADPVFGSYIEIESVKNVLKQFPVIRAFLTE